MIEIRLLTSLKHHVVRNSLPCLAQYGVFASKEIRACTPILCYKGMLCTSAESKEKDARHGQHYVFNAPNSDLVIDATLYGNECRFVNDAFGSDQHDNNCIFVWAFDKQLGQPVLFLTADRRIKAGEELFASYGDSFWDTHEEDLVERHSAYILALLERVRIMENVARAMLKL